MKTEIFGLMAFPQACDVGDWLKTKATFVEIVLPLRDFMSSEAIAIGAMSRLK